MHHLDFADRLYYYSLLQLFLPPGCWWCCCVSLSSSRLLFSTYLFFLVFYGIIYGTTGHVHCAMWTCWWRNTERQTQHISQCDLLFHQPSFYLLMIFNFKYVSWKKTQFISSARHSHRLSYVLSNKDLITNQPTHKTAPQHKENSSKINTITFFVQQRCWWLNFHNSYWNLMIYSF